MRYLLLTLFLLCTYWVQGQDMAGTWTGYVDQSKAAVQKATSKNYWKRGKATPANELHALQLTLDYDKKEARYTGEYYIHETVQEAHFARFELTATYDSKELSYDAPTKLFEVQNSQYAGFCYSSADLRWSEDTHYEYLKGDWEGWGDQKEACASGKVTLRRLKDPNQVPPEPLLEEPVAAAVVDTPIAALITPVPEVVPVSATLQYYNSRSKITKEVMTVAKDSITVDVWDGNREDGDIVSVVFNGNVILEQHTLTKQKSSFRVALQPGQNVLTLIAHNLGDIPPNTAALEVERNEGRKKITLSSDMNSSESVLIFRE